MTINNTPMITFFVEYKNLSCLKIVLSEFINKNKLAVNCVNDDLVFSLSKNSKKRFNEINKIYIDPTGKIVRDTVRKNTIYILSEGDSYIKIESLSNSVMKSIDNKASYQITVKIDINDKSIGYCHSPKIFIGRILGMGFHPIGIPSNEMWRYDPENVEELLSIKNNETNEESPLIILKEDGIHYKNFTRINEEDYNG